MYDVIIKNLETIEQEHDITILFACESGSRAWGFPSRDSDYDVRFIYVHKRDWYLTITPGKDTLDFPISGDLDIGGWELRKTLALILKSNAVVGEWLQSPIIYKTEQDFHNELSRIARAHYSLKSSCYHYLSIAKNTIEQHLQGPDIKMKKYFYILRPLLAARWICEKKQIPPMEFSRLLDLIKDQPPLLSSIDMLLKKKEHAVEKDMIKRIPQIDDFIRHDFDTYNHIAESLPVVDNKNIEELNTFFRKVINHYD